MTTQPDPITHVHHMIAAADNHDTDTLANLYQKYLHTPAHATAYLAMTAHIGGWALRNNDPDAIAITCDPDPDPNNRAAQEAAFTDAVRLITIATNTGPHNNATDDYADAIASHGEEHLLGTLTATLTIVAQQVRTGMFDGQNGAPRLHDYNPTDHPAPRTEPWVDGCPECAILEHRLHHDPDLGRQEFVDLSFRHFLGAHNDNQN